MQSVSDFFEVILVVNKNIILELNIWFITVACLVNYLKVVTVKTLSELEGGLLGRTPLLHILFALMNNNDFCYVIQLNSYFI